MTASEQTFCRHTPSPLHALLLVGSVPLFLAALLSDIAYFNSYQIQWSNFAAWLIAGALVFCGEPTDFATGFRGEDGKTRGRPVGVTVDPRGALIIADDLANTVWRVTRSH